MTKNEARDILTHYNLWRRGKTDNMPDIKGLGLAIDAAIVSLSDSESLDLTIAYQSGFFDGKRCKSSIAQSIRNAAINWPQYVGDVERQILDAFCFMDGFRFRDDLMHGNTKEKYQARTFMLLVAEALE